MTRDLDVVGVMLGLVAGKAGKLLEMMGLPGVAIVGTTVATKLAQATVLLLLLLF